MTTMIRPINPGKFIAGKDRIFSGHILYAISIPILILLPFYVFAGVGIVALEVSRTRAGYFPDVCVFVVVGVPDIVSGVYGDSLGWGRDRMKTGMEIEIGIGLRKEIEMGGDTNSAICRVESYFLAFRRRCRGHGSLLCYLSVPRILGGLYPWDHLWAK